MDVRFVWCGMEVQAEGNAEECAQLIAGLIRSENIDDSEEPCDLTGFGVDDLPTEHRPSIVLKVPDRAISVTDEELDRVWEWMSLTRRGPFPLLGCTEREQEAVKRMAHDRARDALMRAEAKKTHS